MSRFSKDVNAINGVIFALLSIACIVGAFMKSVTWLAPAIMTALIATVCIIDATLDDN